LAAIKASTRSEPRAILAQHHRRRSGCVQCSRETGIGEEGDRPRRGGFERADGLDGAFRVTPQGEPETDR
jgi:hypothetical protein